MLKLIILGCVVALLLLLSCGDREIAPVSTQESQDVLWYQKLFPGVSDTTAMAMARHMALLDSLEAPDSAWTYRYLELVRQLSKESREFRKEVENAD
jgi:hypothetical protein